MKSGTKIKVAMEAQLTVRTRFAVAKVPLQPKVGFVRRATACVKHLVAVQRHVLCRGELDLPQPVEER